VPLPVDPKKPVSRTAIWLLLGVCAGAGSLLYLRKRRAQAGSLPGGRAARTAVTIPTPEPGDLLLFHNARGFNKLITSFTGSPFYHIGLYAGDGNTVEARTSGVVRQKLRGRENDFVVAPAPEGKGEAALAWAETQVGDAYDELDIAVIILDRLCRFIRFNYTPRNKFSCGEFVAIAFDKAGAPLFPERDLGDVVPADFARFVPTDERQRAR
jgi:uncharacterized protein YycO